MVNFGFLALFSSIHELSEMANLNGYDLWVSGLQLRNLGSFRSRRFDCDRIGLANNHICPVGANFQTQHCWFEIMSSKSVIVMDQKVRRVHQNTKGEAFARLELGSAKCLVIIMNAAGSGDDEKCHHQHHRLVVVQPPQKLQGAWKFSELAVRGQKGQDQT